VLATVLIVVITVAIIGLAYAWSVDLFGTVSDSTDDQIGGQLDMMEKNAKIVTATCNGNEMNSINTLIFTVKSTGSLDIDSGEISAYVNNKAIANEFQTIVGENILETELAAGEIVEFVYERASIGPEETITLMINSPAGEDEEIIVCPEIEASVNPVTPPIQS
ncbi:MAG: hypothetical protein KJ906_02585, partial [Nanoarchaeota archaeon]|nr:hypothetical protein [Nanoarchaeota archaeon]